MIRLRTTDFDALATAAPLDRQASVVRDGPGEHWEARVPAHVHHFKAPPLPTHRRPDNHPDPAGLVFGRLTVVRFHGFTSGKWARAMWLVRCSCGDYEVRRGERLRQNRDPDLSCAACDRLKIIKNRDARSATAKARTASALMLDRLAKDCG